MLKIVKQDSKIFVFCAVLASWWKTYSAQQGCGTEVGQEQVFEEEIVVPTEYCLHRCRRWQRALVLLCINLRALVSKAKNYLKQMGNRYKNDGGKRQSL